jgi:hypothetical protein
LRVDWHAVVRVKDELASINGYAHVADLRLGVGVHTISLSYPGPDLTPGSAEAGLTLLSAIALVPAEVPTSRMITVAPQNANALCGRSLDWIEIVREA